VDLGLLESRAPGALELSCAPPAGTSLVPGRVVLEAWNGAFSRGLRHEGGLWRAAGLEPGRYRLSVAGPGLALHQEELEIRAGESTTRALELRAGVERRLRFLPPTGPALNAVKVVLRAVPGERELVLALASAFPGTELSAAIGLAPGSYRIEAASDSGLSATAVLAVPDLAPAPGELVLELF
jgi:hypothetical protein